MVLVVAWRLSKLRRRDEELPHSDCEKNSGTVRNRLDIRNRLWNLIHARMNC
jgi:hypothetical protein